jgi:hypothetical protein
LPVPLTPAAVAAFEELRILAHREKQALDGRERDWVSKMQAHVLRLSITLEYLDWAFRGGEEPTHVSERSTTAAIRLVHEYFWPHTRSALRQIGLNDRHQNARRVLRWLKANPVDEISLKDIRRDALAQALDADQTAVLLAGLTNAGWLRPKPDAATGGRPAHRWLVNPILYDHAESAESAERGGA